MKSILDYLTAHLTKERLQHTYGVCDEAVKLARRYGEEESKAYTAALFHDMYKDISSSDFHDLADQYDLEDRYRGNLTLAHSKLAAASMKKEYGIDDQNIIDAVSFHTTGRAGMSLLEKIIYLADAIEPRRSYPGVEYLRKLALEDIDKACLFSLESTINYLQERNLPIDEDSLKARNYLIKRRVIYDK